MNKKYTKIGLFAVWLVVIGFVFRAYSLSGVTIGEFPEYIRIWVGSFGVWGPVIYISLYTFRTLTFFSATAFTIASGLIFGPWYGILYTIIGGNLAANLAFIVGRFFGKDLVKNAEQKLTFFPQGDKFRKNGFMTVLMMRLLFFPYDWVGYLSGAYNMRMRDFALGTFIGMLPGLIAFVALGNVFENPVKSLAIFLPFFIFGLVVAKILKKKTKLGKELHDLKEAAK